MIITALGTVMVPRIANLYANNKSELVVQLVNNEYIFIEMEDKCEHIDKIYNSIEEMINDLNSYNLFLHYSLLEQNLELFSAIDWQYEEFRDSWKQLREHLPFQSEFQEFRHFWKR